MVTTTAVWQVHSNSSFTRVQVLAATNRASITQNKQQANHDDDSQNTDEAEAATASAAAVVAARAPSPKNDRASNGQRHTGGNGYREHRK